MYSRAEASQARQAFWTAFGQYMALQRSAEGERINWINYKTGEKHIHFRMQAHARAVSIAIELTHKDLELRQLHFDQLVQFKALLHQHLQEEWQWQPQVLDESGRAISRIAAERTGVNILQRADWPAAISFFKPRLTALDAFWSDAKYAFEALR